MNTLPSTRLMIDTEFLAELKRKTETQWRAQLNPIIYGFQFQPGTRWNPGLTTEEIRNYEADLGVQFPKDFKYMLRVLNGTDMPTVNIYGSSGYPEQTYVGVYSYPRDLQIVKDLMQDTAENRDEIAGVLSDQGFELEAGADLVPIYSHRYLVCGSVPNKSDVLSIVGTDAILYGDSLRSYLQAEFLLD